MAQSARAARRYPCPTSATLIDPLPPPVLMVTFPSTMAGEILLSDLCLRRPADSSAPVCPAPAAYQEPSTAWNQRDGQARDVTSPGAVNLDKCFENNNLTGP